MCIRDRAAPYLRSVPCKFDEEEPWSSWIVELPWKMLEDRIREKGEGTVLRSVTVTLSLIHISRKYVAEMVMDRISASRNYLGDAYNDSQPLDYFLKSKEKLWFIHPQTKKELEALLRILNDHGEEKLLHYIKYRYLKGETRKIRY